jgi:putative NADH-flavin reductase
MKIVVIGGSGLIGTKLVNNLRQRGQEVVAASPSSGVNTFTGAGLTKALTGAQVVVDVSNAPSWEDKAVLEFFETSGRNLLAAEAAAGVGHHVALSVVGTDRLLASGYFPRENGPGKSDQGLKDSVHDRPRHAVLRVRGRHRPILHRRCNGSVTIRSHAAHRVG